MCDVNLKQNEAQSLVMCDVTKHTHISTASFLHYVEYCIFSMLSLKKKKKKKKEKKRRRKKKKSETRMTASVLKQDPNTLLCKLQIV